MVVLHEGSGSCDAQVGETVVIRLPETPSTGYQWEITEVPDGLTLDDSRFEPPSSDAPGASGHRIIELRATTPGTHRLTVGHRRGWEATSQTSTEIVVHAS